MSAYTANKPRNRALEDWITTALGFVSAVALAMSQFNFYPRVSGVVSAVALAALGLFTNKPLK
jgi:uncharacterized membrane protein YidH (DUF202 family)